MSKRFDVTGKSVKELSQLSLNQLKKIEDKDVRTITSRLVSASNKRLRRLEKAGFKVATETRTIQPFSIKGKSIDEVREVFAKASYFLQLKTSTVKGQEDIKKRVEAVTGQELTTEESILLNKAWGSYKDKLVSGEIDPNQNYKIVRENIAEEIVAQRSMCGGIIEGEIIQRAKDLATGTYEAYELDRNEDDDDSAGFSYGSHRGG